MTGDRYEGEDGTLLVYYMLCYLSLNKTTEQKQLPQNMFK